MWLFILLIVATTMAIFGCLGYMWGGKKTFILLLILLGTLLVIAAMGDQIVTYLNGMYIGVMLVLKSGLNDIAAGDLDSASAKLEEIESPFTEDNQWLAYLLVFMGAIILGLVIGLFIKNRKSLFGGFLGLAYGYLVAATIVYLVPGLPPVLPVPFLPKPEPKMGWEGAKPAQPPSGSPTDLLDQLWTALGQPEAVQIVALALAAFLTLFLIIIVRQGVKQGKSRSSGSGG
jgi:hypothetical protein